MMTRLHRATTSGASVVAAAVCLLAVSAASVAHVRANGIGSSYGWNLVAVGSAWLAAGVISAAMLRLCPLPHRAIELTDSGIFARTLLGPVALDSSSLASARAIYLPGVTSRVLLIVIRAEGVLPLSMLVVDPWGRLPSPVRDALLVLAARDPLALNPRLRGYMGLPVTPREKFRSALGAAGTVVVLGAILLAIDLFLELLGAGLGIFMF